MKHTKEQRLVIGRRIYDGELTRYEASEEYGISEQTARDYMRLYRDVNHLPPRKGTKRICGLAKTKSASVPTGLEDLQFMTKEELIDALVMAKITEARLKKRLSGGRSWCTQDVHSYRQEEYQVVMELSGQFPVQLLCKRIGIPRSSFYHWKKSVQYPSQQKKRLVQSVALFQEYHCRFPSHGYRWLNAKIRLDKGILFSDPYAHKCCKIAGIKSVSKHYRYKKPGDPFRTYPNLLLAGVCCGQAFL